MDYDLAIEGAPESVPEGTCILLLQPSVGETDRIDTEFLATDTDHFLAISTRTTAREVEQKLEHYDLDQSKATILDTISVDRGYTRRPAEHIHYANGPHDGDGIVAQTRRFLEDHDGKRRVSVDSITEIAYYADEAVALETTERLIDLIRDEGAVGLFHLSREVHDEETVARFREPFDAVIDLDAEGDTTWTDL